MAWGELKQLISSGTQIPSTAGAVYTTPTDKAAQIFSIHIHNTNSTNETVSIMFPANSDANLRFKEALQPNASHEYYGKSPFCLAANTSIYGLTTTASKVNIVIYGREET